MTKLHLQSNRAEPSHNGCIAIVFDFVDHFPKRTVEIATADDAARALADYAKDAEASGLALNVSMMLGRGERAPRGFKSLKRDRFVNI